MVLCFYVCFCFIMPPAENEATKNNMQNNSNTYITKMCFKTFSNILRT